MTKIRSIFPSTFNKKVRPNILNPEPHQRKKEQAVFAKKQNVSKCTANASRQESTVLPNALATVVITMRKAKP